MELRHRRMREAHELDELRQVLTLVSFNGNRELFRAPTELVERFQRAVTQVLGKRR